MKKFVQVLVLTSYIVAGGYLFQAIEGGDELAQLEKLQNISREMEERKRCT